MGWREQQVEQTRRAIVDTFLELSVQGVPVTIAEVARESGISPATIYRHFPNREALVFAASVGRVDDGRDPASGEWYLADLADHLRALWRDLADNLALTRQVTVTDAGRELRSARFVPFRDELAAAMAREGVAPDDVPGRHLLACVALLSSAHAFLDLRDRQQLDVEQAVATVEWAIATLLAGAGIDPATFHLAESETPAPSGGRATATEEAS